MSVTITAQGMPNQSMRLTRDTAEVLLEALARVFGARVEDDWRTPEPDVEIGSISITTD